MIRFSLCAAAYLVLFFGGRSCWAQSSSDNDSKSGKNEKNATFQKEIEKIVDELEAARKPAYKRLADQFELALKRLPQAKLRPEQLLAFRETIRLEEERFEKHGLIPFSEPLRSASVVYLQELAKADSRAQMKISQLILKLEKKLDETQIKDIKRRQQAALKPNVVGRWSHQTGRNPPGVVELLSNGRIGSADSPNHWVLQANGKIQFRWPNAAAPGGVWIDDSQLTPDGMEFKGQNQVNAAALGKLITQ